MKKIIMKNKKMFLLFLVVSVLLSANFAYADIRPNVVVSGFSTEEGAYVGKDFTLSSNITNTEPSSCAKSITSSIEAGFPFIMKGVTNIPEGDLCYGSNKIVNFPLKIDPTASGGFYQIKVINNYESTGYIQFSTSNTLNVFVEGSPEINANIINSEPIDIYPGDTGTLTVKIENDGSFQAQSLSAVMKASDPIEVKWSKSFGSIEVLEPRQSKTIDFSIEVPKNAEAKKYPLSMMLEYYDENKVKQSKNFNFDLYVKKKAQFDTSDDGSDSLYANQNLRHVKILLKNIGTDDARKIKAKILPQFPFSTDGSVRYIEFLGVDKSEPVDFHLDVDKDASSGKYALDLLVDFEDAQGKKLQDTAKVVLVVKPKGILRGVFLDYWILWIIVLVLAGFIARKKYNGHKKEK